MNEGYGINAQNAIAGARVAGKRGPNLAVASDHEESRSSWDAI